MSRYFAIPAVMACLLLTQAAMAVPPHFEGFEDDGWSPNMAGNWQNYNGGDIQRVTSGTGGITSSSGTAHATIYNLNSDNDDVFGNPSLGAQSPYTQFGGYGNSFGLGFTATLDVYLDPSWSDGDGFDYSVAANNQSGDHLRDFVWHVGMVDDDLLVNASNNSDHNYNSFKLENENGGNNYTIEDAGWYTLEQEFRDDGGNLSVDFNLYDDGGASLYSVTRTTSDDIASTVGGNRYGWFVYNNIEGLALDNTTLTATVPEPSTFVLAIGTLLGGLLLRRRRRAS